MHQPRIRAVVAAAAVATGSFVALMPAAAAYVPCYDGENYQVVSHNHQFQQVDSVQLVNRRSGTATLSAEVGESHTSSRSFSGSITTEVSGGFWVFAEAKASATAGVEIQKSTTMSRTYTATIQVPGHSTRTILFGFRRYNQYIKEYHFYNKGPTTCATKVDHAGWVRAPYQKAFIVK